MSWLRRLDDMYFRLERALCLVLLALMVLAVFTDVVHRLASTEGPVERLCAALLPEGAVGPVSRVVSLLLAFLATYGALRTARLKSPPTPGKAALLAAGTVAVGWGLVKALLWLAPNGLLWSQVFALCAMLWVGFIGASLATYERQHLTLEIMEFVWKGKAKAHVGRVGALVASVFCFLLAWLCWLQVEFQYATWKESDHLAGLFDGFAAPRWAVFLVLPWTFAVMALRFLGRAVGPTVEEKMPELKPVMAAGEEAAS